MYDLKCIEPLVEIILVNCNFTIETIFGILSFRLEILLKIKVFCVYLCILTHLIVVKIQHSLFYYLCTLKALMAVSENKQENIKLVID